MLCACSCVAKKLPRAVSLELERKEKGRKRGEERARVSTNQTEADRCGREGCEEGGVWVCEGVCVADSSFSSCKRRGGRMLRGEEYIRVRMHWPGGRGPI